MTERDDVPQSGLLPELEALLELWQRRYGQHPLPGRSRFDPAELSAWARHLAWIERDRNDDFRVARFGVELIRRFGREATGENIDDLASDIAQSLREELWRASATAAPVIVRPSVSLGHQAAVFSELVLPMARDSRRVSVLLLASYEIAAK
jgi:hypothetical protein